jgi:hypothetical protein
MSRVAQDTGSKTRRGSLADGHTNRFSQRALTNVLFSVLSVYLLEQRLLHARDTVGAPTDVPSSSAANASR